MQMGWSSLCNIRNKSKRKIINRIQSWKDFTQGLVISTDVKDGNVAKIRVNKDKTESGESKERRKRRKKLKNANRENESEREKGNIEQRQERKKERKKARMNESTARCLWGNIHLRKPNLGAVRGLSYFNVFIKSNAFLSHFFPFSSSYSCISSS
jgi:hypothetical protein